MHHILQNSNEISKFNELFNGVRLDMSCNRHVRQLVKLFVYIMSDRTFYLLGKDEDDFDSDPVNEVVWNHDENTGYNDVHAGILQDIYYYKSLEDSKDHPGCLTASWRCNLDVTIKTSNNIQQPNGTLKIKWRTINEVLDDAAQQFDNVLYRLSCMKNIIESNGGYINTHNNGYSGSGRILITMPIGYQLHIYDHSKEPCPYNIRSLTGSEVRQ